MKKSAQFAAVFCGCVLLPVFVASLASAADELSGLASQVAETLGYDSRETRKLMDGLLVAHQLNDEAKKELALTVATKISASSARVFRDLEAKKLFEVDRTIIAWGTIGDTPATAATFEDLTLSSKELDGLLSVKPGHALNLSEAEIKSLRDAAKELRGLKKGERRIGIMHAYRGLLAARVESYRAGGIDRVAPYHRGKKNSSPGEDLAGALPSSTSLVAREAPAFFRRITSVPVEVTKGADSEGIDVELLWLRQKLNGREAVVLAHRVIGTDHRNTYLAQRDFYVSHSFDALQIMVGCMRIGEEESVVFYINRTYTEQIAGFASSAAHKIGRTMLEKEVRKLLGAVRAKYQTEASAR